MRVAKDWTFLWVPSPPSERDSALILAGKRQGSWPPACKFHSWDHKPGVKGHGLEGIANVSHLGSLSPLSPPAKEGCRFSGVGVGGGLSFGIWCQVFLEK